MKTNRLDLSLVTVLKYTDADIEVRTDGNIFFVYVQLESLTELYWELEGECNTLCEAMINICAIIKSNVDSDFYDEVTNLQEAGE